VLGWLLAAEGLTAAAVVVALLLAGAATLEFDTEAMELLLAGAALLAA